MQAEFSSDIVFEDQKTLRDDLSRISFYHYSYGKTRAKRWETVKSAFYIVDSRIFTLTESFHHSHKKSYR